jgi:hypothetical protein
MSVSTKLKINGTVIDRAATNVRLTEMDPVVRSGCPTLHFAARGRGFTALPDAYVGKTVDILMDFGDGLGDILTFRGDVHGFKPSRSRIGWIHNYEATGLRDRADRIPVCDDNTGATSMTFNADPGPEYRASRSGRTLGQAILEVLGQVATQASLTALQIGNYAGVGTGAIAHCVMSGRSVSSIVVDAPGTAYDTADRVTVLLIGGGGTGATAGAYTVSAGGIATIPVSAGGSNYLSPPTVVFSKLPAITVADLYAIDMIPPHPITIQGANLFSAIEGQLEDRNPNYWPHLEPDGTLRVFDQRKFGNTEVAISGSPTRTAIVIPVIVGGVIISLWIANGGMGYGSTPTISFTDPTGTGASYTLSLTSGVVTGFTKISGGANYQGGRAKLRIDDAPLWVEGFGVGRQTRECYQRVAIVGASYNEPICLKLSDGTLLENFAHSGLTSDKAKLYFKYDDYVDPFEVGSTALATSTISGGVVNGYSISNGGFGYSAGSPPAIAITPQPGLGAILTINVNTGTGQVVSVTVVSGGSGYDGASCSVTCVGGGGTGATFSVTRSGGVITAVSVSTAGSGYTYSPTAIVYGLGAGSGATATSVVTGADGNVTGITAGSGGSGYTVAPVVRIASHGGSASRSVGTCSCTNTLTVRITPSDPLASWAANYWDHTDSGIHGSMLMSYIGPGGAVISRFAQVTSNTALVAGSYCDVTLESSIPLDVLTYVTYDLVGDSTPASRVYRDYLPANATTRLLLQDDFSVPIAVGNADDTMKLRKKSRFAKILYTPAGSTKVREIEWSFDLNKDTGAIRFHKPVVAAFGTIANLTAGGTHVDGIPTDIQIWIPRRANSMSAVYPADTAGPTKNYAGTSYSIDGLTRTKTIYYPQWVDPSQQSRMDTIAIENHGTMSDTVLEGPIEVGDVGRPFFSPGLAFDFAQLDGSTCGYETAKIPVVSASIQWDGDGAESQRMSVHVSSRRSHYSSADMLTPSQQANEPWGHDAGDQVESPGGFNHEGIDVGSSFGNQLHSDNEASWKGR